MKSTETWLLLDQFGIASDMYLKWEQERIDYWKTLQKNLIDNKELTHIKTREFASCIINAIRTDEPYRISANVLNKNYITNLPCDACVEVPYLVDANGISPCHIGPLSLQCAARRLSRRR